MQWKAVVVAVLAFCSPAAAQEAMPRPGIGVDARGGAVVDPTENVKALNAAEAKRQDDLRNLEIRLQNALRDAETRRTDQLAKQKQDFDLELARILKANNDASTLLLAAQVKELKADSDIRFAKLEQYRYENSGSTSGRNDIGSVVAFGLMFLIALAGLGVSFVALQRSRVARAH